MTQTRVPPVVVPDAPDDHWTWQQRLQIRESLRGRLQAGVLRLLGTRCSGLRLGDIQIGFSHSAVGVSTALFADIQFRGSKVRAITSSRKHPVAALWSGDLLTEEEQRGILQALLGNFRGQLAAWLGVDP